MQKFDLRVGQTLAIGDGVVLCLEKKSGQLARLAIRADPSMRVRLVNDQPDVLPTNS